MAAIPFAIQHYRHRFLPVAAQRLVNWMPEAQPADAKARVVVLPTPGTVQFANLPQGPIRGVQPMADKLFVVAFTHVYRVNADGSFSDLGTLDDGGPVSMAENGTQCIIVVPETNRAWIATTTDSTLTQITDVDFGTPTSVTVLDGYAVFSQLDSSEFFISAINDALDYDALDFATAETSPDNIVTIRRSQNYIWIFGERSIELWQNLGGEDFPFARNQSLYIERGCAAAFSVAAGFGQVFWLGDDLAVYTNQNLEPLRISTHPIEQEISGYSRIADAIGWVYEQEGHKFYVLSFPFDNVTWVFDVSTGVWHERESFGYSGWRCRFGAAFAGAPMAGDAVTGQIWRIDPTAYDEGGDAIRRLASGTVLAAEGKRVIHRRLQIDMATGVGLASGQGSDPQIWIEFSDDAGQTWSDPVFVPIGRMGEYRTRVQRRRLGAARERAYRLSMSDPVGTAIIQAFVDAEPAAH